MSPSDARAPRTIATRSGPYRGPERRRSRLGADPSVAALVERSRSSAAAQLLEARENLRAARRRVVALEDAVAHWEDLARRLSDRHAPTPSR